MNFLQNGAGKKTKAEIINIRNERGVITMYLTDIKKKYEKFYVNEIDTLEETLKSM